MVDWHECHCEIRQEIHFSEHRVESFRKQCSVLKNVKNFFRESRTMSHLVNKMVLMQCTRIPHSTHYAAMSMCHIDLFRENCGQTLSQSIKIKKNIKRETKILWNDDGGSSSGDRLQKSLKKIYVSILNWLCIKRFRWKRTLKYK